MAFYICTKLCENISKADIKSIVIFSKTHNSIENVGGALVLVLGTSSDNAIYLYHAL